MAGIEEWIWNSINTAANSPLFLTAALAGYALLFLFYYGTNHWGELSFGEKLLIGLLLGLPFAALTVSVTTLLNLIVLSLHSSFDFVTGWYAITAVLLVTLGFIRARLGVPFHSPEGRRAITRFLTRDQFPFRHLLMLFLLSFFVFAYFINGSVSTMFFGLPDIIALVAGIVFLSYWMCLFFISTLSSPRNFAKFFVITGSHVFLLNFGVAELLPIRYLDRQYVLPEPPNGRQPSTKRKIATGFLVIGLAFYLPVLDHTTSILTPHLVGTTTTYGEQPIVTTSPINGSKYLRLVEVTTTYFFTRPLVPFFVTFLRNPSNYSLTPVNSYGCNGCSLGSVASNVKGPLNYTLIKDANGSIIWIAVEPLPGRQNQQGTLILTYQNILSASGVTIGAVSQLNESKMGNQTVVYYSFTASNPGTQAVKFDHFFIFGLPSVNGVFSGTCMCPYANPVMMETAGSPLFMSFTVQPNTLATIFLRVQYNGTS